jgi:hypothetical protein
MRRKRDGPRPGTVGSQGTLFKSDLKVPADEQCRLPGVESGADRPESEGFSPSFRDANRPGSRPVDPRHSHP